MQARVAHRGARIGRGERLDERVGAAARGVLLLARGHVGRAHHAAARLAAGADPLAAVGRSAHPCMLGEGEPRHQRAGGRQRGVAQPLGQGRGIDHDAGVHPPVRVEQVLHAAHRLVEVVAEHLPVERAAHAPVAVLGGVDAVERRHELRDLAGENAHRLHAARGGQVDERPDVQAADGAVPVEAGLQVVAVEDRAKARHVLAQALGRHGGVLDEGGGAAGARARRHQQAEPGLAHEGQRVLLGRRLGPQRVVAVAVPAPGRLEAVELRRGLRARVAEEGHVQQRPGVALDPLRQAAVLALGARELEDRRVDQLDRRRTELERVLHGCDRGVDRVEVTEREQPRPRQLDEPDRRLCDRDQRPLRAGDEAREVELRPGRQAVEPVAAGLAPVLRVVAGDRAGVVAQDLRQPTVDRALERGRPRPPRPLGLVDGLQARARAVGEDDVELVDVVDRRPVDDRVAARGVVADHPADRRPVGRRGVRAEAEPVAPRRPVEVLLHHAGADPDAPCLGVDAGDPVHVPRGVEHDALPGGLAAEAGARPARDQRDLEARGRRDGRRDVVGIAREGDEQRSARVQARVAREEVARVFVRAHIPAQLPPEVGRELARIDARTRPGVLDTDPHAAPPGPFAYPPTRMAYRAIAGDFNARDECENFRARASTTSRS